MEKGKKKDETKEVSENEEINFGRTRKNDKKIWMMKKGRKE